MLQTELPLGKIYEAADGLEAGVVVMDGRAYLAGYRSFRLNPQVELRAVRELPVTNSPLSSLSRPDAPLAFPKGKRDDDCLPAARHCPYWSA
jgi:hypothetical protein